MTPFALLQDIAQRCRSHAADLPSPSEVVEYWRGVGFILAGKRYVAIMSDVGEILTSPKLTPVPGVKHWVLGIANVRGRLIPIMDLASFLGGGVSNQRAQRTLIIEKGDLLNGLVVDAVLGMHHFPIDSIQEPNETDATGKAAPFVTGVFERDGERWPVFSFDALSENELYIDIAV